LRTSNVGEGARRKSGMVLFDNALVSSYRPSIITFRLSLLVSEILLFLCSSASIFPHLTSSSIPQIFPCFLGVGEWPFGYGQRRCWAKCLCDSKMSNLCDHNPLMSLSRHIQTADRQIDGRTGGRHTIARPRFALHRAIKKRNTISKTRRR